MILDRRSAVPLHHQFKRLLLDQITSGTLPPGARLSTEREYASQLGISLAPIRQALADLAQQGYLERHKSRGTFVRERKTEEKISAIPGETGSELATDQPVTLEVLGLERIAGEPLIAEKLGLPSHAALIRVRRRGKVKGEPVLLLTSYLSAARFPALEQRDLGGRSLYAVLAEVYGCRIRRTEAAIEVTPAKDEDAALLSLASGSPVLHVERRGFDEGRQILVVAEGYYRADRYRFLVESRAR